MGTIGGEDAKGALVDKLLAGGVSDATAVIVSSLVRQPRDRRVRQMLGRATRVVADQGDRVVATVHSAKPLTDAQRTRLSDALSRRRISITCDRIIVARTPRSSRSRRAMRAARPQRAMSSTGMPESRSSQPQVYK